MIRAVVIVAALACAVVGTIALYQIGALIRSGPICASIGGGCNVNVR
jgi:hypothetical protein